MMRYVILLTLFFMLYSCSNHSVDTKAEEKNLMQISRDWSKSAATDSIEKTLSYWADDAVVMSPGQPPVSGKKAIREMIAGASKIPGFKISWEPLSAHISESGELAYMLEQNQVSFNDSLGHVITEFNKGVTIWRREPDGLWKNIVDIWNTEPSREKLY